MGTNYLETTSPWSGFEAVRSSCEIGFWSGMTSFSGRGKSFCFSYVNGLTSSVFEGRGSVILTLLFFRIEERLTACVLMDFSVRGVWSAESSLDAASDWHSCVKFKSRFGGLTRLIE